MPEGTHGKFAKFVAKLKAEGYSNTSAHNIAAHEEREKYGQAEMTRRSVEGRERAARRRAQAAA